MAQSIPVLICREEGEECIVDLDALKDMGVVHKEFPLPFDPANREDPEKIRLVNTAINRENPTHLVDILERQGSIRTSMKFHAVDEDTVDLDRELAKIKARLLKKYHMVFKERSSSH